MIKDERKILLIELEKIVGFQCYNGNIQNYGAYGEWEGEGREFRYPITFTDDEGKPKKIRTYYPFYLDDLLKNDVLLSGSYKFGANSLAIMSGINQSLEFLSKRYDIDFDVLEKAYQEKNNSE